MSEEKTNEEETRLTVVKEDNLPVQEKTDMADSEPVKMIEVPAHQLKILLEKLAHFEASEDKIAEVCFKALDVFGLTDKTTGEPIEALRTGEGVFSCIFGAIRENISISDFMLRPKKAEKELGEKFGFFKELGPIFEDYARRKKH